MGQSRRDARPWPWLRHLRGEYENEKLPSGAECARCLISAVQLRFAEAKEYSALGVVTASLTGSPCTGTLYTMVPGDISVSIDRSANWHAQGHQWYPWRPNPMPL